MSRRRVFIQKVNFWVTFSTDQRHLRRRLEAQVRIGAALASGRCRVGRGGGCVGSGRGRGTQAWDEAHGAGGETEDTEPVPGTGLGPGRQMPGPSSRGATWSRGGNGREFSVRTHPGRTGRVPLSLPEGDPRANGACAVPPQSTFPFFFRVCFVLVIFVLGIRNLFVNQPFQLSRGSQTVDSLTLGARSLDRLRTGRALTLA